MNQPSELKSSLGSMSDEEVIDWVIPRIEQEGWTGKLDGLNDDEKDFVRGVRFLVIFGNGGLQYFFECDQYGRGTVSSLRRLGLPELAEHLNRAFEYAPPPPGGKHSIDLDRMIKTEDPVFYGLDSAAWDHFESVTPALANFVRQHPEGFAHLLGRAPYDPPQR